MEALIVHSWVAHNCTQSITYVLSVVKHSNISCLTVWAGQASLHRNIETRTNQKLDNAKRAYTLTNIQHTHIHTLQMYTHYTQSHQNEYTHAHTEHYYNPKKEQKFGAGSKKKNNNF